MIIGRPVQAAARSFNASNRVRRLLQVTILVLVVTMVVIVVVRPMMVVALLAEVVVVLILQAAAVTNPLSVTYSFPLMVQFLKKVNLALTQ